MSRKKWFLECSKFKSFGRFYSHLSRGFLLVSSSVVPSAYVDIKNLLFVFASLILLTSVFLVLLQVNATHA